MKNYVLLACLIVASLSLNAQNNAVKLGLGSALISSDINLKYERMFDNHHAVQISLLYDTPEQFGSTLLFPIDVPEDFRTTLSGFAITPEYRYYFKDEEGPRGFYAGVYGRYRSRDLKKVGSYGSEVDFDAKVNVTNFGGGIGCGVQWLIKDAFVIDWYIFGLGYNVYGAKVRAQPADGADIEELKVDILREIDEFDPADLGTEIAIEDLEELKSLIRDEVVNLDENNLEVNTPRVNFGSIELRAGFSIGYAF